MTKLKMTTLAAALLGMGMGSSVALAKSEIDAAMSRIDPDAVSGDKKSTVRHDCGYDVEGWDDASAWIEIDEAEVEVEVRGAKPDTLFTVWVRVKGKTDDGSSFGGSPLTGGGATPMSPGTDLDTLISISPWNNPTGSNDFSLLTNGFRTDANGDGSFETEMDFNVNRGAYPFNLATAATPTGVQGFPVAIHNPAESGLKSAFMVRVVSHCQDDAGHGLAPSVGNDPGREAWFQYP